MYSIIILLSVDSEQNLYSFSPVCVAKKESKPRGTLQKLVASGGIDKISHIVLLFMFSVVRAKFVAYRKFSVSVTL